MDIEITMFWAGLFAILFKGRFPGQISNATIWSAFLKLILQNPPIFKNPSAKCLNK